MVTQAGKVTPEQAGFHHVRCTFADPITGVRCGEIKLWNKKALKDLRPSGKGEWIASSRYPPAQGERGAAAQRFLRAVAEDREGG